MLKCMAVLYLIQELNTHLECVLTHPHLQPPASATSIIIYEQHVCSLFKILSNIYTTVRFSSIKKTISDVKGLNGIALAALQTLMFMTCSDGQTLKSFMFSESPIGQILANKKIGIYLAL